MSQLEGGNGMDDWDCAFFVPQNNPFKNEWFILCEEEVKMLMVTEINRCLPCADCQKQLGEVATVFYEIEGKYYCSKCGPTRVAGTGDVGQESNFIKSL